jgi:predicted PhzF superfamily epimerase YddE/YHI9
VFVLFLPSGDAAERKVGLKTKLKKAAVAAKAVDLTVKDFQRAVGLEKDPAGYVAAAAMLRMLVRKGVAKEVARLHLGSDRMGRKSLVYRMPVNFTLSAKNTGDAA